MDSSVFAEYETDLVTVLDSVADKIAKEAHSLGGGAPCWTRSSRATLSTHQAVQADLAPRGR